MAATAAMTPTSKTTTTATGIVGNFFFAGVADPEAGAI
jgi:hypothetical protein